MYFRPVGCRGEVLESGLGHDLSDIVYVHVSVLLDSREDPPPPSQMGIQSGLAIARSLYRAPETLKHQKCISKSEKCHLDTPRQMAPTVN